MRVFLVVLLLVSSVAHAADFEAGLGYTSFQRQENGFWVQDGFAHQVNMRSPSVSLGLTGEFGSRYHYHVGYRYLGTVNATAQCMGSDALYAQFQKTGINPLKLGTFYGDGHVNQLYLTAGPQYDFGDWHVGVGGGLTVYQATWAEVGIGYQTGIGVPLASHNWGSQSRINTGGILEASAGYKRTDLVLSVQDVRSSDQVSALYHGLATNLSVRVRF